MNTTDHDDTTASGRQSFRDTVTAGLVQKALEPVLRAVREEVAAARREIGERASGAKTGLVLTSVAVAFALTTLVALAGFAVALLALVLPLWAATGITFVVFAIVTAILFVVGLRGIRRGVPPVPKDTIQAAKQRVSHAGDASTDSAARD
ncbi:phage holin family protein [Curtobacterium aurantiacum]|uniref:Phage holin family protein n=1 Tax=Curtobacterium aurantiacum TaxID=3236919 RepID=A0ABS5VIX8_9MICO|nr:phage holin family protein [Curtobacterium flaccumfaciens]MBT1546775.1 phage holin family protein [Curtobacterium flaccumfaciens pv. flaccumfaciens]MBT1589062.1 phage holin family protein [Curtobacterium flaccumfaciens pv. flaccumfaciens]